MSNAHSVLRTVSSIYLIFNTYFISDSGDGGNNPHDKYKVSLNPGNTTWVGELGPSVSMVAVYIHQH